MCGMSYGTAELKLVYIRYDYEAQTPCKRLHTSDGHMLKTDPLQTSVQPTNQKCAIYVCVCLCAMCKMFHMDNMWTGLNALRALPRKCRGKPPHGCRNIICVRI